MANKQLTAKVRLNTTQAEQSIDRLVKKLNQMNNALNKSGTNNKIEQQLKRSNTQVNAIANKTKTWASHQRQVHAATKSTNGVLGSIGHKLKGIAATYLGIMGVKSVLNTSDTVTSAENKLNALNAAQLGSSGYTSDGGDYSAATLNMTAESMDKMYNSAQKVRMAYTDMMSNVSKSMTLAGDSFNNNIDHAIRFQEIMAEAYAVGGASATEMSTSMYQLIQALGSGTLAGDELRSVREGAPLAYKAIEEFVQGVYNCEDSLKDLASQGKVTSDMVVAAVMGMGDEMDAEFARTKQTFGQTWDQIKNAALKAFTPVLKVLTDMLQKALDNGLIEKCEKIFNAIATIIMTVVPKAISFVSNIINKVVNWMIENWSWFQYVVMAVIIVLIGYLALWVAKVVWGAIVKIASFIAEYAWLLVLIAAVAILIYIYDQWKTAAIDTCTAITNALLVIAIAILLIGILTGSTALIIIGIIVGIAAIIFMKLSEILGGFYWLKAGVSNIFQLIGVTWDAVCACLPLAMSNAGAHIMAIITALGAAFGALGGAIGDTVTWIGDWIKYGIGSALEWAVGKINELIAALNGALSWAGISIDPITYSNEATKPGDLGESWTKIGSAYTSTRDAYLAENIVDTKGKWDEVMSTYNPTDLDAAYQEGYQKGESIKQSINDWGSQFQTGEGFMSTLGNLGDSVLGGLNDFTGVDFGNLLGGDGGTGKELDKYVPPSNDELLDGIDGIKKNTGGTAGSASNIEDTLDLAEEELELLRKLAEREVINRFTTAEINVDMTNNNNISSDMDLDGIVTHLSSKLYEELGVVASGVHY